MRKLQSQRLRQRCRQHHDSVLRSLAVSHDDRLAIEVEIFNAQAQALHQTHAGAVQQLADEQMMFVECAKQCSDFGAREDDRNVDALFRAADLVHPWQLDVQHLLVQVKNCRQCLTMGGRRDLSIVREKREERLDLGSAHLLRMARAVISDEEAHPVVIRLLGANAVVRVADPFAQLVEQADRAGR
jgi:hypothetical protein